MTSNVIAVCVTYRLSGDDNRQRQVRFPVPLEKTEHEVLTEALRDVLHLGPVWLERVEFISDVVPGTDITTATIGD